MNKLLCLLIFFLAADTLTQQNHPVIKLKESKSSETANSLVLGSILLLTPTLILEDGKSHFGLSKELSLGKYPYGRVELDYTYIFRSERTSAVHISYNIDIPFNGKFRDPSLFMISPGGGYYTDFSLKGYFAQLAIGLWAGTGFSNEVSIHPCVKFRRIFIHGQPGIFEVSLGVGFGVYSR